MEQYISKSALVSELEKLKYVIMPYYTLAEKVAYRDGIEDTIKIVIKSLEVEGVDLEKEIKDRIDNLPNLYCYMEDLFNGNEEGVYPIPEKVKNELFDFAKYFFELKFKAQKGE